MAITDNEMMYAFKLLQCKKMLSNIAFELTLKNHKHNCSSSVLVLF